MIVDDQLSKKYSVKKLVVYLDDGHETGMLLDLFEMIDQLSNKYLLKINGLLLGCWPSGRNDLSIIDQVVKEISVY